MFTQLEDNGRSATEPTFVVEKKSSIHRSEHFRNDLRLRSGNVGRMGAADQRWTLWCLRTTAFTGALLAVKTHSPRELSLRGEVRGNRDQAARRP
jgi:hypothetical protein